MELVLSGSAGTRRWGGIVVSNVKKNRNPESQIDSVIRLAWEDRTTFEEIEETTGLTGDDVIKLMRRELKPSGFRRWRKRVNGRITKHRKRFKREILKRGRLQIGDAE